MTRTPAPVDRPRAVTVAFWCWVVAAIVAVLAGLMVASLAKELYVQVGAGILIVVGLAQGYLAGRTRNGQMRFAYAGAGLALASVLYLAVLILTGGVGVIPAAVIMILMITGAVLVRREEALTWLESGTSE
jgi:Na+/citrate or Na+/malate symporter